MPGNLMPDYCLPARTIEIVRSEVFWPAPDDPLHKIVDLEISPSDHYLVWADLRLPPSNE